MQSLFSLFNIIEPISIQAFTWITIAALITGISKFSTGGMGMIVLPVLMLAIPGKEALGVIVFMYILTDMIAISTYRKNINTNVIYQVMPATLIGIFVGAAILHSVNHKGFLLILFILTLIMLILSFVLDKYPVDLAKYRIISYSIGWVSGVISMISNAAGPIFSIYLLAIGNINKQSYIGTRSWIFLLMNLAKVISLFVIGLIDMNIIIISLYTIPGVILGSWIGYNFLKSINLKFLKLLIRISIIIGAIRFLYLYLN